MIDAVRPRLEDYLQVDGNWVLAPDFRDYGVSRRYLSRGRCQAGIKMISNRALQRDTSVRREGGTERRIDI